MRAILTALLLASSAADFEAAEEFKTELTGRLVQGASGQPVLRLTLRNVSRALLTYLPSDLPWMQLLFHELDVTPQPRWWNLSRAAPLTRTYVCRHHLDLSERTLAPGAEIVGDIRLASHFMKFDQAHDAGPLTVRWSISSMGTALQYAKCVGAETLPTPDQAAAQPRR
ncbi:MAG: hypothetical protein JSR82_12930 [Verrucomicrobia bacterium]|nr:hypothetical protein [Verrucomicrobiota bacterium]